MKIISQTQDEIMIASLKVTGSQKSREFWAWATPVVVFAIVPSVFFLTVTPEIGVARISCNRVEPKQVDCQISRSKYFDIVRETPFDCKLIQFAEFINVKCKDKTITNFAEKTPFDITRENTTRKVVETINPFLNSQQEFFSYEVDDRFSIIGINAFFVPTLIYLFMICISISIQAKSRNMLAKSRTSPLPSLSFKEIVLNKLQDRFQYTEGELPKKSVKQFTLREVAKVDVIYSTDSYKNIYFTPRITMAFGVEYYLDTIKDRQEAIKVANDLNRFIGLPEEEDPVVKR